MKKIVLYDNMIKKMTVTEYVMMVSQDALPDVIRIIRAGMEHLVSEHQLKYHDDIYVELERWCTAAEWDLKEIEK